MFSFSKLLFIFSLFCSFPTDQSFSKIVRLINKNFSLKSSVQNQKTKVFFQKLVRRYRSFSKKIQRPFQNFMENLIVQNPQFYTILNRRVNFWFKKRLFFISFNNPIRYLSFLFRSLRSYIRHVVKLIVLNLDSIPFKKCKKQVLFNNFAFTNHLLNVFC